MKKSQQIDQNQESFQEKYQNSHLDVDTIKQLILSSQRQLLQKQQKLNTIFGICVYYLKSYPLIKEIIQFLKIEDQDVLIQKSVILQYLNKLNNKEKIKCLLDEITYVKFDQSSLQQEDIFHKILQNLENLEQLYVNSPERLNQINLLQLKKLKVVTILNKKIQTIQRYRIKKFQRSPSLLKQIFLINIPYLKTVLIKSFFIVHLQLLQLPSLKTLDLSENKELSSLKVKNCKNIQYLILNKSGINDDCLEEFRLNQLQNLKVLEISGCKNIKKLQIIGLKKLIALDFSKTHLQSVILKQLRQLKYINMSRCHFSRTISIQQCLNVKIIRLNYVSISHKTLNELFVHKFPKLRQIELTNSKQIIDLNLESCLKLKKINLKKSKKIKSLVLKNCLSLNQIDLSHCFYIQNIQISQCLKVKKLNLEKSTYLNINKQQSNLQKIVNSLPQLSQLNLCLSSVGKSFYLQNCKKLKQINFSRTQIQVVSINSLSNLQKINLSRCKQIKEVILKNCESIQQILINQLLTQKKFKNIASICQNNFSKLKTLNLSGNQIFNIQGIYSLMLSYPYQQINLSQNKIVNIKSLSKVTKFNGSLYLGRNYIIDYEHLAQINFFDSSSRIFINQTHQTYYSSIMLKLQLLSKPNLQNQKFGFRVKEVFNKRYQYETDR